MAKIVLHGNLKKFGDNFQIEVCNAIDAIKCLSVQLKGFKKEISTGMFKILRIENHKRIFLDINELKMKCTSLTEIHFYPIVAGRKSGTGKIILGTLLVATAFIAAPAVVGTLGPTMGMSSTAFEALGYSITYAQIAGFGAALALGGITQMLTSTSANSSSTAADDNSSFIFNGATNTATQGQCLPLLYGKFWAGSRVVSQDLAIEDYNE